MTPLSRTVGVPRAVRPLRVGRGLAAAAAVAALAAVSAAPVVRVTPAAVSEQPLSVGSYNIRAGVSTDTFRDAVQDLTSGAHGVDVAGLQETNSHKKEAVLASLASSGWSYYRGSPGEQSPVIWNSDRFRFVSGRVARVARSLYIGNEMKGRAPRTAPMYVTVVRLLDRRTDTNISVINVHLLPGAVINGSPTPGRPRWFRAFRNSVVNLVSLAASERSFGTVFVLGDFNVGYAADKRVHRPRLPYARFLRKGMTSMWATERPSGSIGSHQKSPALIDQVYSATRATSATVRHGVTYSDHYPVVATYQLADHTAG